MPIFSCFLVILISVLGLSGCGKSPLANPEIASLPSGTAFVISSPYDGLGSVGVVSPPSGDIQARSVSDTQVPIGSIPNAGLLDGSHLYIVQSGSNSVLDLNPNTLVVQNEISVGSGANPWSITLASSTKAYVTNWVANTVSVFDPTQKNPPVTTLTLPTGNALAPFSPMNSTVSGPEGIASSNGKIYVGLTNLNTSYTPGGPGLVVVFSAQNDQQEKVITLSYTNTVALCTSKFFPDKVFSLSVGTYGDHLSGLEVIDTITDTVIANCTIPADSTAIAIGWDGTLYLNDVSTTTPLIVETLTLSGTTFSQTTPLTLGSSGSATSLACDGNNTLYVTNTSKNQLVIRKPEGTIETYLVNLYPAVVVVKE